MRTLIPFTTALLTTVILVATLTATEPTAGTKEKLKPRPCGNIKRIHALQGVFLASQPGEDDFKALRELGIKTVVNLRTRRELAWDESAVVAELGMKYVHLPFRSPESLTDEIFTTARKHLRDKSRRPLLVHCASANRVGAVWLTYRVLDGGIAWDEALAEARQVGLRLPAYEQKAKAYIARQQKQQ